MLNNVFPVPHKIFEDKKFLKLSCSSKILFTILCKLSNYYADKKGCFYRSNKQLAKDSGISTKSIVNAKKELKDNGFIAVHITVFSNKKTLKASLFKIKNFEDVSKY